MANQTQLNIAKKLGIKINNDSETMAAARIHDYVYEAINPTKEKFITSEEQLDLAKSLGIKLVTNSSLIAFAQLSEKLDQINIEAIKKLKLSPGDEVTINNGNVYVISSIGKNYRLWFKGGNGYSAWPTEVISKKANKI
jgi:hypothetical protein